MGLMKKIILFGVCAMGGSLQSVWGQDAQSPEWSAPIVQEVRMPAGVQAGVYYPEHDEMVFVKPGAWRVSAPADKKEAPFLNVSSPNGFELAGHVTLLGHL